jgi:hypothetical protein
LYALKSTMSGESIKHDWKSFFDFISMEGSNIEENSKNFMNERDNNGN